MEIEEFVEKDGVIIKSVKDIKEYNEYTIRAKIQSRGIKIKNDKRIYIFLINLPVNNSCEYPTEIITIADFDNSIDFIEVTGMISKVESWDKTTLCKYRMISNELLGEKCEQYIDILIT